MFFIQVSPVDAPFLIKSFKDLFTQKIERTCWKKIIFSGKKAMSGAVKGFGHLVISSWSFLEGSVGKKNPAFNLENPFFLVKAKDR